MIRSLFVRILLWLVATLIITMFGTLAVSVLTYDPYSSRPVPLSTLITLQMQEARHAWENGGPAALQSALERYVRLMKASEAFLTDGEGRDLLTGESRAGLIREAREFAKRYPYTGRGGTLFARHSTDNRYWYFLMTREPVPIFASIQRAHLVIVALAVVLCGALALYVTSPLRKLRNAMDQFGAGDLEARAQSRRSDEIGQVTTAFNRMADRIKLLVEAERRLLLDISHELRSPLARLGVAIELARSGGADTRTLDRIQKESDRLNTLVGELLEVTRAEVESSQRRAARVRLDELVRMVVDDCSIEASARGCSLELAAPEPLYVEGDPELLRRAVENIVRNAIRYAPKDTSIAIGLENRESGARVIIRDFGPGVPEETLSRLFDPFYRVDADRNRESGGVGLGLSIARRAIELHRGTLQARNAEPGLEVKIEIPG